MKPLVLGYDAKDRAVRLVPDDRRIHMHVLGSSGSGKSRFLEWMIRGDLKNRQGFCLIDPHGELYDAVVAYCARHVLDRDVVLLNLSEPSSVVGFNPFRKATSGDISVQVDRRITATMHAWGVENTDETPTLARTLRLIYTVMMEQGLGLPQAEHLLNFSARDVRSFLVERVQSPLIRREWLELHELKVREWRDEILSAKNRLFKLLTSDALKRFMGLADFSINLREIMDQGKVLLVNLKQSPQLSHEGARTFGALLVNEFFEAALERQKDSAGRDPKPYYLYLDEFQNFVSLDIARMLAEVRKFGLFLILAHQYFEQLDEEITAAALNNCQIKAVFGGLSATNARLMAEELFIGKLDPLKIKVCIHQTKFWPEYRRDKIYGKSSSSGSAHGTVESTATASFSGSTSGQSFYTPDNWFSAPMAAGTNEIVSSGMTTTGGRGYSDVDSYSTGESEVDIPVFFPVPFQELSSVQYYTLEEQLTELTAALKIQFQRHCFIQIRQRETQPMLVPFVEPVTTFTYSRKNLDWYIQRQHERNKALPVVEVDRLLEQQELALLKAAQPALPPPSSAEPGSMQTPEESHEAERLRDDYLAGINNPVSGIGGACLFRDFLFTYNRDVLPTLASTTQERSLSVIKNHLKPQFGDMMLKDLTLEPLQSYFMRLQQTELSFESIDKIRDVLSAVLRTAVEYGRLSSNPAEKIRLRRRRRRAPKPFLRIEQFYQLVDALAEPYASMVYVGVFTGLRVSEIAGLKWHNIHASSITVEERYSRGNWDEPKSESSRATIPVDQHVIDRIVGLKSIEVAVKAGHATRKFKVVKSDGPDDLVFQSVQAGAPVRDNNILSRHIKPAARNMGMPWLNWQVLRRSCATWLQQAGVDVKDAQGILRHSRASTTQDVYQQLVPESQVRAVKRLSDYAAAGRSAVA